MKQLMSIVMLVILLVGCSGTGNVVGTQKDVVKIGVIGALTGGVGDYFGQQELKGVELALEEINAAGGINGKPIQLIIEDSQADPKSAVSAVSKLIHVDGIEFIIGDSWASTTSVIVPVTNENDVLLFSPIALLDDLSADDLFFRNIPHTRVLMHEIATYAYDTMGVRRLGMVYTDNPWGFEHSRDLRAEWEALGGIVTGVEKIDLKQVDVRTELVKIQQGNPDVVFNLHASNAMLGVLMKQAHELGLDVQWIGTFSAENAAVIKAFPNDVEGQII